MKFPEPRMSSRVTKVYSRGESLPRRVFGGSLHASVAFRWPPGTTRMGLGWGIGGFKEGSRVRARERERDARDGGMAAEGYHSQWG